jgi:hypothetical protein
VHQFSAFKLSRRFPRVGARNWQPPSQLILAATINQKWMYFHVCFVIAAWFPWQFWVLNLVSSVCSWECTLDGVSCFLIFSPLVLQSKHMILVCYQMDGLASWGSTVVTYDRWSKDYVYGDLPSLSKTLAKLTVCNLASWEVYGTCFARVACIEQCTTPLFWIIGCFDFSKYLIFIMHLDICYI